MKDPLPAGDLRAGHLLWEGLPRAAHRRRDHQRLLRARQPDGQVWPKVTECFCHDHLFNILIYHYLIDCIHIAHVFLLIYLYPFIIHPLYIIPLIHPLINIPSPPGTASTWPAACCTAVTWSPRTSTPPLPPSRPSEASSSWTGAPPGSRSESTTSRPPSFPEEISPR